MNKLKCVHRKQQKERPHFFFSRGWKERRGERKCWVRTVAKVQERKKRSVHYNKDMNVTQITRRNGSACKAGGEGDTRIGKLFLHWRMRKTPESIPLHLNERNKQALPSIKERTAWMIGLVTFATAAAHRRPEQENLNIRAAGQGVGKWENQPRERTQ